MVLGTSEVGNEDGNVPSRIYRHHRPKMQQMLLKQLQKIGIPLEFNHRVVDYYEDIGSAKGGIILDNGEKLEADLVIAADGVGTKSYNLVAGRKVQAESSGYAIFRTAYPVELALADPEVAERFALLENNRSVLEMWVG